MILLNSDKLRIYYAIFQVIAFIGKGQIFNFF